MPDDDVEGRLKAALADRYRIERELGAGGMATVYLAHDLKHDRKVAIKVMRPELSAILGGERFLREVSIAAKLNHPHILALYDSGEAEEFLYYVMPYVEGESLRDKLNREKQLSVDDAISITKQVGAALDYAHEQGVIHRDIKPENILFQAGEVVVADFGIALAVDSAGGTRLTETGFSLGTPAYMSHAALIDSLNIDSVAVVGISGGGPTALQFAAQYPERVWALVMICAISKERLGAPPERGRFARLTDVIVGEGFVDWIQVQLLTRFPEAWIFDSENEYLSSEDQDILRADDEKLEQLVDALTKMIPLSKQRLAGRVNDGVQWGRMGEPDPLPIVAPTLVIHGTSDPVLEFEHAESAARRVDGAVLFPVEGAGHFIVGTHWDLVGPEILGFLNANKETGD